VDQPSSPSLLRLAGTAVIILVPLIYLIIALNTGDLLWISPIFNYQPQTITVNCFGETLFLESNSTEFESVVVLVNDSLTGRKRWDPLSLSDATYQDYQSHPQMMVVELTYPEPIRVHSRYKFFSNIDRIIIPLVGRHAQTKAVFGRLAQYPAAGSFHVDDLSAIKEYLADNNLCVEP
jgi:hypothetical protein